MNKAEARERKADSISLTSDILKRPQNARGLEKLGKARI